MKINENYIAIILNKCLSKFFSTSDLFSILIAVFNLIFVSGPT